MMLGLLLGQLIVLIHVRSAGVYQDFGLDQKFLTRYGVLRSDQPESAFPLHCNGLDVVGGYTAVVQAGANEIKHKTRIVIVKITIGIFESTFGAAGVHHRFQGFNCGLAQIARWFGKEAAYHPVKQSA